MDDILRHILKRKAEEIGEQSASISLREAMTRAAHAPPPRGFSAAMRTRLENGRPAIIAEIKKASPSKGVIRAEFHPAELARSYELGGATCLSVLTDRDFFQGGNEHLQTARAACSLPILRKDFIVDPYQVYQSRALGADCVLLIVAALDDGALLELSGLAKELGMDVLIETHNTEELQRSLQIQGALIGINNRDLRNFATSLDTTLHLSHRVPPDRILVTESGIHSAQDVALMRGAGVNAFLIGEAFMRAPEPGAALMHMFA